MSEHDVETIEISLEVAQKAVNAKKSFEALQSNPDFIKIIEEGYFENESVRVVLMRANPGLQSDEDQIMLNKQADAIAYLRQYFITIMNFGRQAEKDVSDHEEALDELRQENTANG